MHVTDNVGSVECGTPPGTVPGTPGLGHNPVNHVLHLVGQSSSHIEYNKAPGPLAQCPQSGWLSTLHTAGHE